MIVRGFLFERNECSSGLPTFEIAARESRDGF